MAFDHEAIVLAGRERLRAKLSYTNLGFALAPDVFTLPQLREVYAAALGHEVSATNLKRVLLRRGLLAPTGERRVPGRAGGRPGRPLPLPLARARGDRPVRSPKTPELAGARSESARADSDRAKIPEGVRFAAAASRSRRHALYRPPGYAISDCRSAVATACVRVSASSFDIALRTCERTVSGGDEQLLADLLVRAPVGEQAQDVALALRQASPSCRSRPSSRARPRARDRRTCGRSRPAGSP